ncbi:hypothetical protein AAMO2058_000035200 [Amorphochlora amoebiformis]
MRRWHDEYAEHQILVNTLFNRLREFRKGLKALLKVCLLHCWGAYKHQFSRGTLQCAQQACFHSLAPFPSFLPSKDVIDGADMGYGTYS